MRMLKQLDRPIRWIVLPSPCSHTSPANTRPLTARSVFRIRHSYHHEPAVTTMPAAHKLASLVPRKTGGQETPNFPAKVPEPSSNLVGVVPTLPPAVVVRVQDVDVVRARVTIVWHVEGDLAHVLRLPCLGLGDAHQLREDVVAGRVGEERRWWVAAEGNGLDVDAHLERGVWSANLLGV